MATESFEIIDETLSWPTRLSRTRVSSVQGLSLSETSAHTSLNLEDVLRTVQRLGLKRCLYSAIENLAHLGEGESFCVDRCIYEKQTVAVKHIKLGSNHKTSHGFDIRLRAILNEIQIMHHAPLREHPNILSILGYGWRQSGQTPMPYIVVEYAVFGSLRQYLTTSERSLRTKIIMAGDIAAGLNALHQCDIVHGDLKLENVVVLRSWDRPPGAIAKICDFGHAIVLSGDKKLQKYYGTALYNPPEVECQNITPIDPRDLPKCDMWAYGLSLWEIFQDGRTYFKKSWGDEENNHKTRLASIFSNTCAIPPLPTDIGVTHKFGLLSIQSEESAKTLLGVFDLKRLAGLAIESIGKINFGGAFVDKAILRKFLHQALQVDPKDRPLKITLGPLMCSWNPADMDTLRAKLSIHTGSAGWSFNLLKPDQEKEIVWEHQSQILKDFEQISKLHKSPDEAAAAAFQVAMCYISGFGTKKDLEASTNFIEQAEMRNHPAAKLFGPILRSGILGFTQVDNLPNYETQVIQGFKSLYYINQASNIVVHWKSLECKAVNLTPSTAPQELLPQYQELYSGDIIEYSTITKVFQSYTEFRDWITKSARDGAEPFLLTLETAVTTVPSSLKMNLFECAIVREDTELVTIMFKHIDIANSGYSGDLPIITACRTGNMNILQACLANKQDPFQKQPDGSTLFHWIFMLGADVRFIFKRLTFRSKGTKLFDTPCISKKVFHSQWPLQLVGSPLAFSIAACSLTGIAALLRLGADPLATLHNHDNGSEKNSWTPLHLAAKYHSPDMLALLILASPRHEADLDSKILAAVKARLVGIPYLVDILGGKKSKLAKALTKTALSITFTNPWDATVGCALTYSTPAERIAVHGRFHTERLTEIIALLPSSCLCLSSRFGRTPLMQAIDFNDLPVITALLERFPKLACKEFVDPFDGQFTFPIHFASQIAGRRDADDALEILKILVKHEPNHISSRDSRGKTPLHYSATGSSERATKWLIEKGCSVNTTDNQGQTALHSTRSARNLLALLDAGSSIDQQDNTGRAILHMVVPPGSEDIVKLLMDSGANINLKDNLGQAAIHHAVMGRSRDVCVILLDAGADTNIQTNNGDTPLHLAIRSTRSDIVKLMLDHDANISATNIDHFTPLHQSIVTGDLTCFNRILDSVQRQNPDLIDSVDLKQQTPLHMAAAVVCVSMAEKLLQHGANAGLRDKDGNTAFHIAAETDPSLCQCEADKIDFLDLLYTHWSAACRPGVDKEKIITASFNIENAAGKTAWDIAYERKSFAVMDFIFARGSFEVSRFLEADGHYIGNLLLNCAIDVEEWDFVITLLRHERFLSMHPILGDDKSVEFYSALRMNDKWALKKYLNARRAYGVEGGPSGLEWLNRSYELCKLFDTWHCVGNNRDHYAVRRGKLS